MYAFIDSSWSRQVAIAAPVGTSTERTFSVMTSGFNFVRSVPMAEVAFGASVFFCDKLYNERPTANCNTGIMKYRNRNVLMPGEKNIMTS
jgi:hypothetical protein